MRHHRLVQLLFVSVLCLPALLPAQKLLDEGTLDPSWFAGAGELRKADEIDYLWVKPGFTFAGKRLQFDAWEPATFAGEKAKDRDAKDKRLANDLTASLPQDFAEAFRNGMPGQVEIVDKGANVRAVGRIVDCSGGSTAAKFWVGMGAGSGSTTFDLKFVDAKSGELLAALHHRVVSGTNLSTTQSKLVDWIDEFAESIAKSSIEKLYQAGKKAKN